LAKSFQQHPCTAGHMPVQARFPVSFHFARAKEKLSSLAIVFFGRPSDIRLANGRR
jgi:hypothetical protein